MIAQLYTLISPYTFVPAIAAIERALHTGSLTECTWAIDAALRDPKIQRMDTFCARLREWKQGIAGQRVEAREVKVA